MNVTWIYFIIILNIISQPFFVTKVPNRSKFAELKIYQADILDWSLDLKRTEAKKLRVKKWYRGENYYRKDPNWLLGHFYKETYRKPKENLWWNI